MSIEELVFWTQEILRSDGTDSCWDVLLPPMVVEPEKDAGNNKKTKVKEKKDETESS